MRSHAMRLLASLGLLLAPLGAGRILAQQDEPTFELSFGNCREVALERPCPFPGTPGVQLYVQDESLGAGGGVAQTTDELAGAVAIGQEGPAVITAESPPGEEMTVSVYAALGSRFAHVGAQGWSLSIAADDGLELTRATTEGTAGADASFDPAGVRDGGFEKTELVDPNRAHPATGLPQGQGAVSAVVLSFVAPVSLEPVGSATVLRLDLTGAPGVDEPAIGHVVWRDDMAGGGQPVQSLVTLSGQSLVPACV